MTTKQWGAWRPGGPGRKPGRKPGIWKTGPDPRRHDQYIAWLRHRAQARYRGESHTLEFEQWESLWNDNWAWENRGRGTDELCLAMLDPKRGWCLDNVQIMSRLEQLRQAIELKTFRRRKQ